MHPTATPPGRRRWRLTAIVGAAAALTAGLVAYGVSSASAATVDTSAWYVVVNHNSGKAMDVWQKSTADGGELRQYTRNDGTNQQFQFVDAGSGYYKLRNRNSGLVVAVPNSNDGVQVIQTAQSTDTRQDFTLKDSSGGYVRFLNRSSNKVLDMWDRSTADGGMVSQYADGDGTNQQWQLVKVGSGSTPTPTPTSGGTGTGLVGWATQNGGTTGGAGGTTVTVSTLADLTTQAASGTTETIRVNGNFSCSADVRLASNKTILGVGSGSGLTGCGFNLKSVRNVILRNLKISKVLAANGNGDAIHIEKSTNLWIDHNDLSSDTSHGTDYYDGLLDITHAADYITVSWNILHDHVKCSLVGHSDSNAAEDTGHLRVTYHHNEFKNCAQRNPRVRFANPVHVFNNYYVDTQTFDYSYGIASTDGAGVLVEGNYFENISGPTHLGEGDSSAGSIVARNNYLTGSGAILTGGSVAGIPYAYTVDSASSVKSIVTGGAGTGKITT
jgi:pectate lyase